MNSSHFNTNIVLWEYITIKNIIIIIIIIIIISDDDTYISSSNVPYSVP